jgi:hypothetical protein
MTSPSTVHLPASALAKARNYTLGQWDRLARCLDYPQVEMSNNWAENSMRPVHLGQIALNINQLNVSSAGRPSGFAPGA